MQLNKLLVSLHQQIKNNMKTILNRSEWACTTDYVVGMFYLTLAVMGCLAGLFINFGLLNTLLGLILSGCIYVIIISLQVLRDINKQIGEN